MIEPESGGASGAVPASESHVVFERFRRVFGDGQSRSSDARKRSRREPGSSAAFGSGRDALGLGDVIESLTASMGWTSPLAQSDLLAAWEQIAGEETAKHATPTGIDEGTLTVVCDSTAWATQLRLMRMQITTRIAESYPDAGIQSIRFDGPGAPSWKRGPRSIPGRGPRDTYG